MAHLERTQYGFRWGAALVEPFTSIRRRKEDKGEHVCVSVITDGGVAVKVYVSPSGRSVRVFKSRGGQRGAMRELR